MDKKIVLFDMDGTLCKYDDKLLHLAHKRLGLPLYRANDLLHFHTELVFEEQYREQVGALADEEGFSALRYLATVICASPSR